MAKLQWDQIGQRLYEAGIDRGVLYLSDDRGVAWSGLTSIDEDLEDIASEPVFFDGVKIMDHPSIGDFSATLNAFTYPDEFLEYEGIVSEGNGMFVDGQSPKVFGLCYRTKVGNDTEGPQLGYKLHIVYNVTAVPDSKLYETQSTSPNPLDFSWKLTAVPEEVPGFRPTAHVILDSRFLPVDILAVIEDVLYGTGDGTGGGSPVYDGGSPADEVRDLIDGGFPWSFEEDLPETELSAGDPRLPPISELIFLTTYFGPKVIVPDTVTGLAQLIPGDGDLTQTSVDGVYSALPDTRLTPSAVAGLYELIP